MPAAAHAPRPSCASDASSSRDCSSRRILHNPPPYVTHHAHAHLSIHIPHMSHPMLTPTFYMPPRFESSCRCSAFLPSHALRRSSASLALIEGRGGVGWGGGGRVGWVGVWGGGGRASLSWGASRLFVLPRDCSDEYVSSCMVSVYMLVAAAAGCAHLPVVISSLGMCLYYYYMCLLL